MIPGYQKRPWISPIPPRLFTSLSFTLLSMLWGSRLCLETADDVIQTALRETHHELSIEDHQLLCIGSWLFQTGPMVSVNWEFYRFTFHECSEPEADNLFHSMGRTWSIHSGEDLQTKDMASRWRNMIVSPIAQKSKSANRV